MVSNFEMNEDQIATFALSRDRDRFRHLSGYLLQAREVERGRIAKELHDKIGQGLTAVMLHLHAMQRKETAKIESLLAQVTQVVEVSLARVIELSSGLRPPQLDLLGLGATLKWYLQEEPCYQGLTLNFLDKSGGVRLNWQIETVCFRVVQEALSNVFRHAGARLVTVTLSVDKSSFHLQIEDDGNGMDPVNVKSVMGLGLMGMQQGVALTGGTLKIDSALSRGTIIHAIFPLKLAVPRVRQKRRVSL
jgi:two-component system, NarL family, sensor histidine kinase UhpB